MALCLILSSCVHLPVIDCFVSNQLDIFNYEASSVPVVVIEGMLYYVDPGIYEDHICRVSNDGKKTICSRYTINCDGIDLLMQSQEGHLFIVGYREEKTLFFTYNLKDNTIKKAGEVNGYVDSWVAQEDRIYYTEYRDDLSWNRDLFCYELEKDCTELVERNVYGYSCIENGLIIAAIHEEINEIHIERALPSSMETVYTIKLSSLPVAYENEPRIVLNEKCVIVGGYENSVWISLDDGTCSRCPDSMDQILLEGNIIYFTKSTDGNGSYGRKLYKWRLGTDEEMIYDADEPIVLISVSNGEVLLQKVQSTLLDGRELYIVNNEEAKSAARY